MVNGACDASVIYIACVTAMRINLADNNRNHEGSKNSGETYQRGAMLNPSRLDRPSNGAALAQSNWDAGPRCGQCRHLVSLEFPVDANANGPDKAVAEGSRR
jgi:hypothetical protein